MKAVLLAAGEGARLQPITATRPKHLIKIAGKPILEHCLNGLKENGVTEAVIVTHYMGKAISNYFGDGSKFGFKLEYVEQEAVLGTGNAASLAEQYLKGSFMLIYGDLLFSAETVKVVLDTYREGKPAGAMAVVPVDKPENYGVVELDEERAVMQIVEKPKRSKAPSNLANAGIYVLDESIFDELRGVKRSLRGEWELTDALTRTAGGVLNVFAA